MIDDETLKTWTEWSRRDDALLKLFIPSDIRQMLGEIGRLREENKILKSQDWDALKAVHSRTPTE